jgi:hypothetical protein
MNDFYVYIITDNMGVPVYVGKGRGRRGRLRASRNAKIEALISFGGTLPPVKVKENLTEGEAHEAERALIAFHGRDDLGLGPLLNLGDGGIGTLNSAAESREKMRAAKLGRQKSSQHCERLSIAAKNRWADPAYRAKNCEAMRAAADDPAYRDKQRVGSTGRQKSPETRARIGASKLGKPLTADHRAKLSKAARNRAPMTDEQRALRAESMKAQWERKRTMRAAA